MLLSIPKTSFRTDSIFWAEYKPSVKYNTINLNAREINGILKAFCRLKTRSAISRNI